MGKPISIERILVVRMSALGDCFCAIPVFAALREQFPKAHIAWAIQDNFAPLIHNLRGLDELIIFPRQRWKHSPISLQWKEGNKLWRHLRMRNFDAVVDVQSNTKSGFISSLTQAPMRIGHGQGEAKELSTWFTNCKVNHPSQLKHIIYKNLNLLTALGIEQAKPEFPLPADPFAKAKVIHWLNTQGVIPGRFLLLVPFCGRPEKEWPPEKFMQLSYRLAENHIPGVFLQSPGKEKETQAMIPSSTREHIHFAPPTTILEMVEFIRQAQVCFGGDTGPLQIAGGLGIPNVACFGPTDPDRLRPLGDSTVIPLQSDIDTVMRIVNEKMNA